MGNKHLTEDEIRYTVDVKTADAQKAIYTLEQQSKKLRSENKARLSQMISLEAAGRKESEAYRNLKKQYSETSKETVSYTHLDKSSSFNQRGMQPPPFSHEIKLAANG